MKRILPFIFLVLLLQVTSSVFATDYYSIKSGNAADVRTWNSSRTGNGTAPSSFNDGRDNFIVQNNSTITGNANFNCKGSLIIETGGTYVTGSSGNISNIASVVTINDGGLLKLSPKTLLVAGFVLVQGTLANEGGEIRFNSAQASSPVAIAGK
jgi:hypothetical protein